MKNWKVIGFTITTYTMIIALAMMTWLLRERKNINDELLRCKSFEQTVLQQSDSAVLRINLKP